MTSERMHRAGRDRYCDLPTLNPDVAKRGGVQPVRARRFEVTTLERFELPSVQWCCAECATAPPVTAMQAIFFSPPTWVHSLRLGGLRRDLESAIVGPVDPFGDRQLEVYESPGRIRVMR